MLGGTSATWPEHSAMTLGLKKGHKQALDYFFGHLESKVKKAEAIAVVPGHEAGKPGTSGVRLLARRLAGACGCIDATRCLVRHTTIDKKATGGDRSKQVDLDSIEVHHSDLIEGKRVLLLDDVKTSGNSLLACRELLLHAGAAKVVMVAMGRTTH